MQVCPKLSVQNHSCELVVGGSGGHNHNNHHVQARHHVLPVQCTALGYDHNVSFQYNIFNHNNHHAIMYFLYSVCTALEYNHNVSF